MLNPLEEELIAACVSSSDHDYFVWTGLLGEPSLLDGVLSYFDGETATVVGFPLVGQSQPSATWVRRLRSVIAAWLESSQAQFVSYIGPFRVPDSTLPGWSPVFVEPPVACNVDIFLDLDQTATGRKRRKARQNLHRAARSGLVLWIGQRPYLGAQHLRLLRSLAARDSLSVRDVGALSNVVSILRSDRTTVFEATVGERLAGFCVAHQYYRTTAFAVVAAFDPMYTGCADLVYSAMIDHFAGLGVRQLGLGYAFDEGSYRFKTKWAGARAGKPFYELIWERRGASPRFNGCLDWPWGLLSRQLACGGYCDDAVRISPSAPLASHMPSH